MPPKKAGGAPSKKTEQKKKEKTIEDKTFGLKNKKGGKQQKFIQQVEKQVIHGNNKSAKQLEKEREQQKLKKEDDKKKLLEMNQIFKPVVTQNVQKGVDPKSVLCQFFKLGQCTKGSKCKFSHDLTIQRKSEKRSAYVDARDEETNENWDEGKLKDVVEKKHGKEVRANTTQIICKHFLDAVEGGKYGWFWNCPGGDKCIYRHALPPGFILKKDKKKMEKAKETISLEDLIERERAALGHDTTKVTLESFLAWKRKKLKEKDEQEKKDSEKKKNDFKSGKDHGLSGREMFDFNPDLAVGEGAMEDGDGEFDLRNMENENGEEIEDRFQFKEIDFNSLISEYKDVNNEEEGFSVAQPDRLKQLQEKFGASTSNGTDEGAVAIDEDLFGGDDEDLDEIEEELEEMNLS